VLVLQDTNGGQIGTHLQAGHKPAIALGDLRGRHLLHREITYAAERANYQLQYVMTGNARAGETYFSGAGGCNRCHAPTGDLKGNRFTVRRPRLQALIAFGTITEAKDAGAARRRACRELRAGPP